MKKNLPAIISGIPVHFGFKNVPLTEAFYSRAEMLVAHV